MSGEISYKTHILVGVGPNGVMTVITPTGCPGDAFLADIAEQLRRRFGIVHSTLQVERGEMTCALFPESVV